MRTINNNGGRLTRNVLACYRRASDEARAYGDGWYLRAHRGAARMAAAHGLSVRTVCGVIAALSPSCSWTRNVALADELLETGDCSHMYGDAIEKARRIVAGEDPADVLGGDKVRSFFDNLLNPALSAAVTVDRHAFDVAVGRVSDDKGRKVLETGGRAQVDVCGERVTGHYRIVADAYRAAGRILGVPPHQVQAVTWCQWRAEKGYAQH